jgi:phage terminase large subunit
MPYQQLIADCNPDAPTHWLWLRSQSGPLQLLHSRHEDNPRLYRAGQWTDEGRTYLAKLDDLGVLNPETGLREGAEYQRLRNGQWVQATGQIFDTWSDGPLDGNVTEAAEYQPDAGSVFWAIDDGYAGQIDPKTGHYPADAHPRVFLLVQQRADGRLCAFAESYACQRLSDTHLDEVQALSYPSPEYAATDSSAAELRGRLHARDVYTRGKPHDVEESIKVLRAMLAADANGWRRILVHPRCTHLRAEMASYRRDANGKIVKAFDHGPDALRYLAWTMRHGQ